MVTAPSGRFIASPLRPARCEATSASSRATSLAASVWSRGRGSLGTVPYTSAPTSTSTMLLVMRFQVASPTVKRVSPKYGPLSLTS
jgi:hypothetical protein